MKILLIILVTLTVVAALHILYKEWKKSTKPTPDDNLYFLRTFVEKSLVIPTHAKYIKDNIREFKLNKDMNQKFLLSIESMFQEKFKELAEVDEFSPEHIDVDKFMLDKELRKKLNDIEEEKHIDEKKTDYLHFDNREDGK